MNPPPTTLTRVTPRSVRNVCRRSTSVTVFSVNTSAWSTPGMGGTMARAPGERMSLSYDSSYSVPSSRFRTRTVRESRSMATASLLTRAPMRYRAAKACGVIMTSLPVLSTVPLRRNGRLQLENETCGPLSSMTISARSSNRRRRVAAVAPAATPPMITTFMATSLHTMGSSREPTYSFSITRDRWPWRRPAPDRPIRRIICGGHASPVSSSRLKPSSSSIGSPSSSALAALDPAFAPTTT